MYGVPPLVDRYGLGLHMGHGAMVSCVHINFVQLIYHAENVSYCGKVNFSV